MKLHVKNFRSIEDQEIELGPITLVYGPNGAGKSSLLYTLLTLKNIVLNPSQILSGFFNYTFMSLGSLEQVVFDHEPRRKIELSLQLEKDGVKLKYEVALGEKEARFTLVALQTEGFKLELTLPVTFPYSLNQTVQQTVTIEDSPYNVNRNGVTAQVQSASADAVVQQQANRLGALLTAPVELLRRVGTVPLKRGFSKPVYSSVPVSPLLVSEDEVASFLSTDKYLVSKLSVYLESMGRDFRVHFKPGSAVFSLDATDKRTGVASELVNEGFGVNQVVYLLARCLHRETELICVEEPEIHLHPAAVRSLAAALARIVRDEGKRFVISTHSEPLILAFLALVAKGELQPADLVCYLARKENKRTVFEREHVNEGGQIEGGLASFMEGELADVKVFLGLADNQKAAVAR